MSDSNLIRYKDWYNTVVATGTDSFEKFQYHLENQISALDLVRKHVLEVGCGKGAVSLYLALLSGAREVVALDEAAGIGAPVSINKALRNALDSFGLSNLTVIDADIMQNDFPTGSFDVIISNNALHHVVDSGLIYRDRQAREGYVELFSELKRLLRDAGTLSIVEYSRTVFWRWSPVKLKWKAIEWHLHPTRKEWLSVIRDSGLNLLNTSYMVPYKLRHLAPFLRNPVAQFFLASGFLIVSSSDARDSL
jgi:SAM-dependent methyltransferase